MKHICPVCGFNELHEPPRSSSGGGSYEICPSCRFEFGVTDEDKGLSYQEWRNQWIKHGMPWDKGQSDPPSDWDPVKQLKRVILHWPMNMLCPVCGYELWFQPWEGESPSYEICPCCDIQFGYQDANPNGAAGRPGIYKEWRDRWIAEGTPWDRGRNDPPLGWDPVEQLKRVT